MSPRAAKPKAARIDWLSLLQFGLGALGISVAWFLAISTLLGSLFESVRAFQQPLTPLGDSIFIAGIFFIGLLLVPSTVFALRRILSRPTIPTKLLGRRFGLVIFLLPILLFAGAWAVKNGSLWLIILLHLLAAVLVVAWLLWLAVRGIQLGSSQRSWGTFASGLVATPLLAFVLEILGGLLLLFTLGLYIGTNSELTRSLNALQNLVNVSEQTAMQSLRPLLNDPVIFGLALFALSVAVPIIEELLKPLGVYLLLGRNLTRAQGFALGALCGAGFALAENLTRSLDANTLFLAPIARLGASALHIFTAALSGYALVRAKEEKRVMPLVGVFALNIFLHGLWNGMTFLTVAGVVSESQSLICIAPLALIVMAFAFIFLLRRYNRNLSDASYDSAFATPQPKLGNL